MCKSMAPSDRPSSLLQIRTKGEAGTGNVVEAVRHERKVMADIRSVP